jgi:hypothetical protein
MFEKKDNAKSFRDWISTARRVAAWLALIAFLSFLVPHIIIERFEPNAWKYASGAPRPPQWAFSWRGISVVILLIAATLSFPKWQSLITLAVAIILFCLASCGV